MPKKQKEIVFCQGDKKELEDITGEEYKYLDTTGKQAPYADAFRDGVGKYKSYLHIAEQNNRYTPTFFTYKSMIPINERAEQILMGEVSSLARQLGADAIIHYTSQILLDGKGSYEGFAKGTLMAKKEG